MRKESLSTHTDDQSSDTQSRLDSFDKKTKKRNSKHKTTEFSYLLERKALRIMRRYYKEGFDEKYSYK